MICRQLEHQFLRIFRDNGENDQVPRRLCQVCRDRWHYVERGNRNLEMRRGISPYQQERAQQWQVSTPLYFISVRDTRERKQIHLHQSLRIISSPLLKITTFWKPSQSRERRSCSNPTKWIMWATDSDLLIQINYLRSMSSIISCDFASPCTIYKYSLTQATIWSLKVPLMTWCRRSGERSSWMSARGKFCVKG